jgi:hypothetical protein
MFWLIREFDLIQIFQQLFDLNLLNRILKYKNLNIHLRINYKLQLNSIFKFHVCFFSNRKFLIWFWIIFFLEELGAAFFPTEAWGQPLTFDLGPAGFNHPALLHTALHGPPMVGFCKLNLKISIKNKQIFLRIYYLSW